MVTGIDKFIETFRDYRDNYIVIGGTACDLLLTQLQFTPRATADIDMIVVVENMSPDFQRTFWTFIKEGGYQPAKRTNSYGEKIYAYYRFINPTQTNYPMQIELLARHAESLGEPKGFPIEPIPAELSSLSAIIMNDDLYSFVTHRAIDIQGVHIADAASLVVLKVAAYLNLMEDKENGKHVDSRDLRKHRTDVARLLLAESWQEPIVVTDSIYERLVEFAKEMREHEIDSLASAISVPRSIVPQLLDILTEYFVNE